MQKRIGLFVLAMVFCCCVFIGMAIAENEPITLAAYRNAPDSRIGCLQFGVYQPEWLAWENMIEPLGIKRIRFSVCVGDWDSVDWSRSDYALTDALVERLRMLAQNGVKITYVLTFWDTDHHTDGVWGTEKSRFKSEEDIQRYLDFVKYVVTRCKGIVLNYEFFNEPSRTDSPIQYIEPADYVNLVRLAVPVIRGIDSSAKLIIGATSDLFDPAAEQWLFDILKPDILPLVDGISWHGMGEASPQYPNYQEYLKRYPALVDKIKTYARERGFQGVFISDEMRWGTPENHNADKMEFMYTEITSAKYFAREIVRHLGMDVVTGIAMDLHDTARKNSQTIRNLCEALGGARPYPMPIQVQCAIKNLQSFGFKMQNGDIMVSVWRDEAAADACSPVPADIELPGMICDSAELIDVLNGTHQSMPCEISDGNTVLKDVPVLDYPMLIRLAGVDDEAYADLLNHPEALAKRYRQAVLLNGGRDMLLGLYDSFTYGETLRQSVADALALLDDTQAEPIVVSVQGKVSTPWDTCVFSTLTGDYIVVLAGAAGEAVNVTLEDVKGKSAQALGTDGQWTDLPIRNTKKGALCNVTLTDSYEVIKVTPKNPRSRVASFKDAHVEAAVCAALGKPQGLVSLAEAATITQLDIKQQNVASLEGLQALTGLTYLNAPQNSIRDLTPLSGLTQLTHLELWNNQIKDISPLEGLMNLEVLWIGNNPITDISPLKSLTRIWRLGIWDCRIKKLDTLKYLPLLTELDVRNNPAKDNGILNDLKGVNIASD